MKTQRNKPCQRAQTASITALLITTRKAPRTHLTIHSHADQISAEAALLACWQEVTNMRTRNSSAIEPHAIVLFLLPMPPFMSLAVRILPVPNHQQRSLPSIIHALRLVSDHKPSNKTALALFTTNATSITCKHPNNHHIQGSHQSINRKERLFHPRPEQKTLRSFPMPNRQNGMHLKSPLPASRRHSTALPIRLA